ncbi:MAG: hypothetical protein H6Q73_311 [Firmicutes bacterium]|nr:hypothetical protein [Bacillota bacterium]
MFDDIKERELGLGDIIKDGWAVYSQQITAIILITLLVYLPMNIAGYFYAEYITRNPDLSIANIVELFLGIFVLVIIAFIAQMAIVLIVEHAIKNDKSELNWMTALRQAFFRLGSLVGSSFLGGLIIVGLTLFLVIPGIIWSIYYTFVLQVVVLRDVGGKKALDYSKSLVKGRWWRVFWKLLAVGIIYAVIASILGAAENFLPECGGIITDTCASLAYAFYNVASTVLFLNLEYINLTQERKHALG